MAILFLVVIACCNGKSEDGVPLIFAAASLSDVLTESADIYERDTGKRVDFSFGGSITLANQVANLSAPADGVLFAGGEPGQLIIKSGLMLGGNAQRLITNTVVVIGGRDFPVIGSLADLALSNERIAVADPQLAPAGTYAMLALEAADLAETISDQLIFTGNVRAALAAVESGNTKYGIVYMTDALTSNRVKTLFEIQDLSVDYFISGITDAHNSRAAQTFLNYVFIEPATREVFKSAGFEVRRVGTGPGDPGG